MKKILIIEDDQVVANIYRNKFQMAGFVVELAYDGEEGVAKVDSFQPDIVQLDLMMPKLNGVEVIKQIRANPKHARLPIIVLSNSYLANLVQEAWKAGANRCVSKADSSPKTMMELVDKLLEESVPSTPFAQPTPPPPAPGGMMAVPVMMPQGTTFIYPSGNVMPSQGSSTAADMEFQAELRRSFTDLGQETMATLRSLVHNFLKETAPEKRDEALGNLLRKVRSLTGNAGLAGAQKLAKMSSALEAFLIELHQKPEQITPSTLRTVAQSVDFLEELFRKCGAVESSPLLTANILVVDDEIISRRAVMYALEKVGLKCLNVDDPNTALAILSANRFDLVFLDVDMPAMSGHELCQKIRALPAHEKTPVVFVTGLSDFDTRAKSMLSGGNDFIAKPFIFLELGVKALIHVLRASLGSPSEAI